MQASGGAIWVGSLIGGVARVQNDAWKIYNQAEGHLGDDDVEVTMQASDSAIWVGTRGGGVARFQETLVRMGTDLQTASEDEMLDAAHESGLLED